MIATEPVPDRAAGRHAASHHGECLKAAAQGMAPPRPTPAMVAAPNAMTTFRKVFSIAAFMLPDASSTIVSRRISLGGGMVS